jgi:hypothetical protein
MEDRGLVGIEARAANGEAVGRISEVIEDESGAITHVVVERGEERLEVPIASLTLDRNADFATFHADPSDDEPGDHVGDEVGVATVDSEPDATPTSEEIPQGYAPNQSDTDDTGHEGQFVTTPTDPEEAVSLDGEASTEADQAGGWEDEASNTVDSGYPRTDVYIDPQTGEEQVDPQLEDNDSLGADVRDLVNGTGLAVLAVKDGVVQLGGSAATSEDLAGNVEEVMGLDGVLDVDTTDVDVG